MRRQSMLSHIEVSQEKLEQRVEERTKELRTTNVQLKQEITASVFSYLSVGKGMPAAYSIDLKQKDFALMTEGFIVLIRTGVSLRML